MQHTTVSTIRLDDPASTPSKAHAILHQDIFKQILHFTPIGTRATLLRVSRMIFEETAPSLYRTLSLSRPALSRIRPISAKTNLAYSATYLFSLTRHLVLPLHSSKECSHATLPPLPNLHTLELALCPSAPLGWSFCRSEDVARYPYYPITLPCRLITQLKPRKIVVSGISTLHSISPLVGAEAVWDGVEEVVLILGRRPRRMSHDDDCFLSAVPSTVRRLSIRLPDLLCRQSVRMYTEHFAGGLRCLAGGGWTRMESEDEDGPCEIRLEYVRESRPFAHCLLS